MSDRVTKEQLDAWEQRYAGQCGEEYMRQALQACIAEVQRAWAETSSARELNDANARDVHRLREERWAETARAETAERERDAAINLKLCDAVSAFRRQSDLLERKLAIAIDGLEAFANLPPSACPEPAIARAAKKILERVEAMK